MGGGSNFQSQSSPQVVFKVGTAGQSGTVEITDIMYVPSFFPTITKS
jgi:hypothetical protein